ncbi:MAG: hypothetical protein OXC19_10100 [Bryobacterales bacterium]|nr:hypothetical protein [Bryobacterales bacterium]
MYLLFDTAKRAVNLLVKGNSIRSMARIMDIERNTVLALLHRVGADCNDLLRSRVQNVDVSHLELDLSPCFAFVRHSSHVKAVSFAAIQDCVKNTHQTAGFYVQLGFTPLCSFADSNGPNDGFGGQTLDAGCGSAGSSPGSLPNGPRRRARDPRRDPGPARSTGQRA